jgi:hypothetical protein
MKEMKKYHVKPGHRVDWDDVNPEDKGPFDKKEDAPEETEGVILNLTFFRSVFMLRANTRRSSFFKPSIPAGKSNCTSRLFSARS